MVRTIEYDGRNAALVQLMDLFTTLGGRFVETKKTEESGYAKEIARRVAGVKSGRIKTRPIKELLKEA